jgi:folate-binding protein YgfZ
MAERLLSLPDRGLIALAGQDASKFLQDLVTADIAPIAAGEASYAGLLSPQGKILFDFFVIREAQAYVIDCLGEQREELAKRLKFYRLRAKLDIAVDQRAVAWSPEGSAPGAITDPRSKDMGARLYGAAGAMTDGVPPYHERRIRLGLAEGGHDFGPGEIFPHEANFDQIGAVSFKKGCFVGQEVVSRMEHRGTARSRILPVAVTGAAPPKGTPVTGGGKTIGSLCSSAGERALALLRLDRLEDALSQGVPVMAGAVPIVPMKPPWARYNLPVIG